MGDIESHHFSRFLPRAFDATGSKRHRMAGFSLIEIMVVLAIMAALFLLVAARNDEAAMDWRFDQTGLIMEQVKAAIVGKPGLFSNGVPQHTGYVADMGNLPGLFTVDQQGGRAVPVAAADLRDPNTIEQILSLDRIVQPRALWTRDLNSDGSDELTEAILWRYHTDERIWSGWHGPYLPPPEEGILKDAWGHPLVFLIGELVNINASATGNTETYRCIRTHDSGLRTKDQAADPPQPGPHDPRTETAFWQKFPLNLNAPSWWLDEEEKARWFPSDGSGIDLQSRYLVRETYYDDALLIVSFGQDGTPGGSGLNADLMLTIYKDEYTGEVGGHAGYGGSGNHCESVELHYPAYTETEGRILTATVNIRDDDQGYGINFCFGGNRVRAVAAWECDCEDEAAECECIDHEETDCVAWGWDSSSPPYENGIYNTDWYSIYGCDRTSDQGVACSEEHMCFPVACDINPTSAWHPLLESPSCREYDPNAACILWRCKYPVSDDDCDCEAIYEKVEGDSTANYAHVDVPIGVRSLNAGSGPLVYTVSPGANWIGTVK